jgi:hypothetical protein
MRKFWVFAIWFVLGLGATNLAALAMEQALVPARNASQAAYTPPTAHMTFVVQEARNR